MKSGLACCRESPDEPDGPLTTCSHIMTTKEIAKSVIDALPEDAWLDDIMRALYIRAKLERSERSIEEGRGIPQAEVKQRLQKWLK